MSSSCLTAAGPAGGPLPPDVGARRRPPPTFPVGPLVAAVDRAGGPGELIPWPRDIRGRAIARAYSRAKSADGGRIGVALADRLAVELLGVHPAVIWHDWSRA